MKCTSCATENDAGLRYCVTCGSALTSHSVAPMSDIPFDTILPSGSVLKGTYEVIRVLGEGGAGAVYEGRHIQLGHPVAVKILFAELARIPQIRERFVEEGRIQANLRHPNLVHVTDIVDEAGVVAIVMEFVRGETLHHFIQRQRDPVEIEKAVGMTLRVLSGLSMAHQNGIVHRDIKPGNILLADTDQGMVPKLCDFGIAKVESSRNLTVSGTKMGTLHYMAPEQFQDARTVDARADIYSLGVTFFELLTGRLPFDSDNEYALMRAHLDVKAPSPRGYRPDLPKELEECVMCCLEKRPQDRYGDADRLAEALLEIPVFRTLRDFRSNPAVSDVSTNIQATAMGVGEHSQRNQTPTMMSASMQAKERIDRRRAAERKLKKKDAADEPTKRTGLSGFSIFLVVFAALLVGAVVAFVALKDSGEASDPTDPPAKPDAPQTADAGEEPEVGSTTLDQDMGEPVPDSDSSCGMLVERTGSYVQAPDVPIPQPLGLELEANAEDCADHFATNADGSSYFRLRSDVLLIGQQLFRLQQDPGMNCVGYQQVNMRYTNTILRLAMALEAGQLPELERGPIQDQRERLQLALDSLTRHFNECE